MTGDEQFHRRLVALQGLGKPVLGLVAARAVAEQKRLVPRKTGNLGRSIHVERVTAREAFTVASEAYGPHVEFGTRPHVIRPKNRRYLRFPAAGVPTTLAGRVRTGSARALGAGAFVFAKIVHHPGTKAQPFMLPGAKKALDAARLKDIVIRVWNNAA